MVGRFVPSPDRKRFRFPEVVLDNFGFLVTDFGYTVATTDPTFASLIGPGGEVRLYHGRGSYEIGFEMVFPGADQAYSLREVLIGIGCGSRTRGMEHVGSTPERMQKTLEQLAQLAQESLVAILRGDLRAMADVRVSWHDRQQEAKIAIQVKQLRTKCNRSWVNREYTDYVRLIGQLEMLTELTAVEKKRREIALRKG